MGNAENAEMTSSARIPPGTNIFQKEGLKARGNLLNTINGNFTAATRSGLLSNNAAFKWFLRYFTFWPELFKLPNDNGMKYKEMLSL